MVEALRSASLPPEVATGAKLLHEGKETEAVAEFDKAVARNPSSPMVYYAIAQETCNQMNKPDLALRYAERGLQATLKAPRMERARLFEAAAAACAGLGDYAKAVGYSRSALALEPDNPLIKNDLAYELAELGANRQDLEEALTLATAAVQSAAGMSDLKDENMGVLLDTLGWVHYKLGEYPKAAALLAQAADLAPSYPDIYYHLARAYKALGQDEPARVALDRADKSLAAQDAPKPQLKTMIDELRSQLPANPKPPSVPDPYATVPG